MITLLTSRWKAGKTTLLSILLARLTGGETLAGSSVTPGRAIVLTEEPPTLWEKRHNKLRFGPGIRWSFRPFLGRPRLEQWLGLIEELSVAKCDLIVFDPLSMFLPGAIENQATALLDALEPLRRLTDAGAAVLLVHHPRKGVTGSELSPRGSGALTGFADILVDLDRPLDPHFSDRVRRLSVSSRLDCSFRRIIELNPDGRDYVVLPTPPERDGFEAGWPALKITLEDCPHRLTRNGILNQWPTDYDKPSKATLVRWLEQAIKNGLVERHGIGRNHDPYKYWLKGRREIYEELRPLEPLHYGYMSKEERRRMQQSN
jgi:hypothetical protein